MLQIDHLHTFYGRVPILKDVNMTISQGEVVALLGANGAGKTTLLRVLSGLVPIASGRVLFEGEPLDSVKPYLRIGQGIAHAPEGRQVFGTLTVEENLRLGGYRRHDGELAADLAAVYGLFPVLEEMRRRTARDLSGGQQQMLAIGRAMMGRPRLLLLDEPSLGLAPLMIAQIFAVIGSLRERGVTILVVEQNAAAALAIADRGYVLETGRVMHSGSGKALLGDQAVRAAYLGI
ncbi:ABC transporter ATP-binding protein [Castellaniella caeni]|uniref:ABC transporter ATP-binding protein n=1 Tax=Castellaniella caeni TaxID=266123 RepID=UPI0008330477|nr:ABC transporter ATP-binding protein [Castellaniella caeni]